MGVILLWARFFAPKPTVPPPGVKPTQSGPATARAAQSSTNPASASTASSDATAAHAAPVNSTPRSESQERTIVVENDLYRVEFSNRGAVVKSWQLKKYFDDAKPPHVLDVVHAEAATQTGGWPFALVLNDSELAGTANGSLYPVSSSAASISAPADLDFAWSDGRHQVTTPFPLDQSYLVRVRTA